MSRSLVHCEALEQPVDAELGDAIYAYWLKVFGDLDRGQANQRLKRVVAIGRDVNGEIIASCAAIPAPIAALGSQRLLVYRCLLAGDADTAENWMTLLGAAVDQVFDPGKINQYSDCIGLLVPVTNPAVAGAHPEAVWPETGLLHAGYGERGLPVRVRYFKNARLAPVAPA